MIYIEPIHVKWEPGKHRGIEDKSFESYMAQNYVELVKERVREEKYKSKWKPLSPAYKKWKEDNNLSPKTWEATGELMRNLKVKSHNTIGFDNRRRHKMSGEKYIDITRKLEYGNRSVPARPLFRLVYWYMSKNIEFFYVKYLKEVRR